MMKAAALCLLALMAPLSVSGHARWKCPPPRDSLDSHGHHDKFSNTGNKEGPCGPASGKFGLNGVRKLEPGWQTLVWEESIAHAGSPFRLAILDEHENVKVVLLDHIPHWDDASPVAYLEKTYVQYKMTVNIPDIKCSKCSLQLLYFMTDKSTKCGMDICTYYAEDSACSGQIDASQPTCFGAPNDNPCKLPNTCFSNYHSCSDVTITGTLPISLVGRAVKFNQPEGWPYAELPESQYGLETGNWKNGWLEGIPSNFTTLVTGSLKC